MTDRIREGLQWLTGEISADRDEFMRAHPGDGDDLLTALHSHGYVKHQHGRYGVTMAGFDRMGPVDAGA